MNLADLPRPQPVPLEWITPSIANDLLDCPYRVAWLLDTTYRPLRRPNTYSALGNIAHGVIEDAAHGRLIGEPEAIRSEIERRWNERATQAEEALALAWEPAKPPSREEWPGYHLTKARIIRRAMVRATRSGQTGPKSTPPIIEGSLVDYQVMLRGRPDRVEGPGVARRIVDVKSGVRQGAPSPPQLRQLMLYGHLVEASTSDRVEEITIEDASGNRWAQRFDREATISLVAELIEARKRFNLAAHDGSIERQAAPSAENCRWCPFRVVCSPYWSSLQTSWGNGSVLGVIRRAQPATAGSILEVEAKSPSDAAGSMWVVSDAPTELAEPGREVAIAGGELTGAERHLRWRWSTLVWPQLQGTLFRSSSDRSVGVNSLD